MKNTILIALVAALSLPALAQESIFPSKEEKKMARQLEPHQLTEASRSFLKGKMKNHIKDMRDLSVAVAILKGAEVQRLAQGVANTPRLDKNVGPAAQLPARFFELQDQLRTEAQALADAGKANDMNGMIDNYQALVSTCATCHATFRAQVAGDKK